MIESTQNITIIKLSGYCRERKGGSNKISLHMKQERKTAILHNMDKDIRDFLDRVEQKRLSEAQKRRKEKRLENERKRVNRKSHKNAIMNSADLLCRENIKEDRELRQLPSNGRNYSSENKFKTKQRSPKAQKKFDWENRPRFILTPMGGQSKKR